MAIEAKHITALTEAMATGCTVPIDGKDWVFSPHDFGDLAEILQHNKSKMMASYIDAIKGKNVDRVERIQTMYDIQMRAAKNEDFVPSEPGRMVLMAWLSLKHAHPDMSMGEVVKLFSDPAQCDLVVDAVNLMRNGPSGDPSDPLAEKTPAAT